MTDREGIRGLDVVDNQCVYGLLAEAAVTFHIGRYRLSAHFLVRHPHTEIVKTPCNRRTVLHTKCQTRHSKTVLLIKRGVGEQRECINTLTLVTDCLLLFGVCFFAEKERDV